MKNAPKLVALTWTVAITLFSTADSTRADVISIDFNDLSGVPPFALVGQISGDALQPWTSEGDGLQVIAGDLRVETPALTEQSGTPQSASGKDPVGNTAALMTPWAAQQVENTVWFSFLFRQLGPDSRVGISLNDMRIIASGPSLRVVGVEGNAIDDLELEQTHLVVGCIEIDAAPAAPDTIQVWVNPYDLNSLDAHDGKYSEFSGNFFHARGLMSIGIESYAEPQGEGGTIDRIVLASSLEKLVAALAETAP